MSIALSYRFFGISEWSTRLVPLIFTSATIALIFLIGSKLWDLRIGVLASVLALATPMVQYFGKNASHEPLTLFFILTSFYGYISLGKEKWAHLFFVGGLILAQLTAWAGYFLIPALTLTHLLRKEFNKVFKLFPYWILSIALFSIHLLHTQILTGSITGGNLFESLLLRSGLASNVQPPGFDLLGYLNQLRLWFSTLYTLTLTILALVWLMINRLGVRNYGWPIFSLGMVGLIYATLFSSSVFIHNYLLFYFLPFLSLAGASTIFWLREGYDTLVYHNKFKKPYLKFIPNFIVLFFLALIIFERRDFLIALNNSQVDKLAVEVGRSINRSSKSEETVLVSPLNFSYSADKFLRFYSDRKLIYSDDTSIKHDVWVVVDQDRGKFEIMQK